MMCIKYPPLMWKRWVPIMSILWEQMYTVVERSHYAGGETIRFVHMAARFHALFFLFFCFAGDQVWHTILPTCYHKLRGWRVLKHRRNNR